MAIRVKVNIEDVMNRGFEALQREIDIRAVRAFQMACKEAVTWAKQNHGYKQQSGALNSSTGFQLYRDGALIESYFEASQGGSDSDGAKAMGVSAGKRAADRAASQAGVRICAVIVAGMPYAIHVEAGRTIMKKDGTSVNVSGRDVLTGAYHQFPAMLEKWMEEVFSDTGVSYSIANVV